MFKSELTLAPG